MTTVPAQAKLNLTFIEFREKNSVELSVRIILDKKTVADFCANVSPVFSKLLSVQRAKFGVL